VPDEKCSIAPREKQKPRRVRPPSRAARAWESRPAVVVSRLHPDRNAMASNKRQLVLYIFLAIAIFSVVDGIRDALHQGALIPALVMFVLVAVALLIAWRSRAGFSRVREQYRERFEATQDTPGLRDAALFSLTWSREIYRGIPEDRKRLVKQAFILIGIAMAVMYVNLGSGQLGSVVLVAMLTLAGVNLLVWVFSTERGERDRLRFELATAREMQMSLMPGGDPEVAGYDISGVCIPARNVGGDHFDYLWLDGERREFAIAVVDVAGKGMDAAMTAVFTSGALVAEVQCERDIATILSTLNTAVRSRNNRARFVSLLLASVDVESGVIRYANAGQSRPVLCSGGEIRYLPAGDPHFPLGVVENVAYPVASVSMQPGDVMILYTDGLTEAMNAQKEVFGEERLAALMRSLCGRAASAAEVVAGLREGIARYSGEAEQHDDMTIVAVRRR
jgi:hypothetical protein